MGAETGYWICSTGHTIGRMQTQMQTKDSRTDENLTKKTRPQFRTRNHLSPPLPNKQLSRLIPLFFFSSFSFHTPSRIHIHVQSLFSLLQYTYYINTTT